MAQIVPSCDLTAIKLTEEYILSIEAFLSVYPLTAFEAQIILEVSEYPEHHIDIPTLKKKIPKEFFKNPSNDVERSVNSLIKSGYLQPYESKKEELCVRCSPKGRDTAKFIRSSCFSESLKLFDEERKKLDIRRRRLCVDPLGLKVNQKRYADGPKGKTEIIIKGIFASDVQYEVIEGRVEYERRIVIDVTCPQCGHINKVEYCFNPTTLWQRYQDIECEKCKYFFSLAYSLMYYYEI